MAKDLSPEQKNKLFSPLPAEALKPHPTKSFLTVISSIFVIERLNDVFGLGKWEYRTEPIAIDDARGGKGKMCVVKGILDIPEYGIHLEQYGGNDNTDMGDAYKGAATDALTKIASYLGIGFDIYKGRRDTELPHSGRSKTQDNYPPF